MGFAFQNYFGELQVNPAIHYLFSAFFCEVWFVSPSNVCFFSIFSFNLQCLKTLGKPIMKAEKEKVAKSLELLNFLLKTVTGQVSAWPSMWQMAVSWVSFRCRTWILPCDCYIPPHFLPKVPLEGMDLRTEESSCLKEWSRVFMSWSPEENLCSVQQTLVASAFLAAGIQPGVQWGWALSQVIALSSPLNSRDHDSQKQT